MKTSCWGQRTKLEIALLCVAVMSLGIITTLTILQVLTRECLDLSKSVSNGSCSTQTCIKEALQILDRIDTTIDPCQDFYSFSCNNMPTAVEVNKQYGPFSIIKQSKLHLEAMYNEPINNDDHNMVKIQKKLYRACLNESAIELDAFRTVKAALKAVGGWPVVEGPNWNESAFDWLNATFKLRQLGYPYTSYLDLNIVVDPRNEEKYIFQISIPEVKDVHSKLFNSDERNAFMMDIAVVLGAQMHRANPEMTETLDFLLHLQWKRTAIEDDEQVYRMTVENIQRRHGTINWLEFINTIVGRTARISKHDFILFPSESAIDMWFGTLLKAPKRLQANYMMWRVVEEALPYLTTTLLKASVQPRLIMDSDRETRTEYCIKEVRKRFSPSPIDIMYLRKYLPKDKKEEVLELLDRFQSQLLEIIRRSNWMDAHDKATVADRINDVSIIIGAPGDYFDNKIFNDMHYNINKSSSNNFLKLLSEADKNHRSQLYNLINQSTRNSELVWWEMSSYLPTYDLEENEIVIPANILQNEVFNEQRPHYLNYGIMGITLKNFLYGTIEPPNSWSNSTSEAFLSRFQCLINEANMKLEIPDYLLYQPLRHVLGLKVSYAAYKDWIREKENELPLFAIDYTPEQLFWMSSGYIFCHYTNPLYDPSLLNMTVRSAYNSYVSKFINDNLELKRDFGCSTGSELYYQDNCKIF